MPRTSSRTLLRAALPVVAVLTLAGCSAAATAAPTPASTVSAAPRSGGSSAPRTPGVAGLIADVSGGVLQVQGSDGQTAVGWTDTTKISTTATGSAADITAGVCVSVRAAEGSDAEGSAVTAASVTVSQAVDGACSVGLGGLGGAGGGGGAGASGQPSAPPGDGQGGRPSGDASGRPTDLPSGMPSGGPGGGGGFGASGLVSAVDGSTLTVTSTRGEETTTATVLIDASTAVTKQVAGTSKDLAVGRCVVAQGQADATGAVAATSLAVSEATDGACTTGAGRQGGR